MRLGMLMMRILLSSVKHNILLLAQYAHHTVSAVNHSSSYDVIFDKRGQGMREGHVKMMQELREGENRQSFKTPGDWSNKRASKASAFAESSAI